MYLVLGSEPTHGLEGRQGDGHLRFVVGVRVLVGFVSVKPLCVGL